MKTEFVKSSRRFPEVGENYRVEDNVYIRIGDHEGSKALGIAKHMREFIYGVCLTNGIIYDCEKAAFSCGNATIVIPVDEVVKFKEVQS